MTAKLKHLSILLLGAVVASGCSQQQQRQAMPPAAYSMLTVAAGDCSYTKSSSASISGREVTNIVPQISGALTEIRVDEGDKVQKGEVMFVIDQVPYRAAVASAEAAVASAKAAVATAELTLKSKKSLYESKVVSEFDYLTAENAALTARAQLANAEAGLLNANNNLSYTTVKSPMNGVIGTLPYSIGALVSPAIQMPLTTVSDNSLMEVYFSMTESDLLGIIRQYGSREKALEMMPEVSLQLSDGSMYELSGKISSMSGVIDRATGAITMRADFKNPNGLLHSGASGNVVVPTHLTDVITIPIAATFEIQDKVFVFQSVEGVAKSKMIEVTRATGTNNYIVKSGLTAGEQIVAEGVGLLREGTPIQDKAVMAAAQANAAANEQKK